MGIRRTAAALAVLSCIALAAPAAANFHIMRIVQVYGGDVTHPDAQYVVLQMCIGGQNELAGHNFRFHNAAGTLIGSAFPFTTSVPGDASQAKILLATSSAAALFNLAPDFKVPASILPPGGKVCFDTIDCVGWGAYTALPDATIGTPYDAGAGLPAGSAIQRDLAIAGGSSTLDCFNGVFDDTDNSAADFDPTVPTPGNNAGASGVVDADHIFLHAFEGGVTTGWSAIVP
jgi:hypothetical protein